MVGQVRVFVSHHHNPEEDAFTARLADDLRRAGADVWVDKERIWSDDFVKKINEGLIGRQWLVLVMTPGALRSQWVQAEVNAALNLVRKGRMLGVVPIVAKPCDDEDIPPLLDPLHRYDATSAYEPARDGLLQALGLSLPAEPSIPLAPEPLVHAAAPVPHPLPSPDDPSSKASSSPSAPAQPAQQYAGQTSKPKRLQGRSTEPAVVPANVSYMPSDASVARPGERAGAHGKRLNVQITRLRPTLRQLLLLVLAIAVIGGGIAALASWRTFASAFGASSAPTATTTALTFQRTYAATQTARASQLIHDYSPAGGIGLCDTVDPPYGSTTEHSYWESQGTVRCPGAGVTELDHGGRVEFFGFALGFPLRYQVSATFNFPSTAALSCVDFNVGSVGGRAVDISLCNDGSWSGNGGTAGGTVSVASSYKLTISVTPTAGAVSINGATVIPSEPLIGETYSIQIDASGISSGDALDVSDFVLHPIPA